MADVQYYEVDANEEGQRLDNYLLRILKGVPKSHIYRIIRSGEVRVNKKRANVSQRLEMGDVIRVPPVRVSPLKTVFVGDKLTLKLSQCILHEENGFMVINKPRGLAVHGGSGLSLGLIEALRNIRNDLPYLELVHRLDKETSGCLILAKKRSVLRALQRQFEAREITKTYCTLWVHPWVGKPHCTVNASLSKNILQSGERFAAIDEKGKPSQTQFSLLENFDEACFVEARPLTGRTHQIRAHSAHLGHPILGDEKYGGAKAPLLQRIEHEKLYLHARSIQFTLNDTHHAFQAPLDERFEWALQHLRKRSKHIDE